MEDPEVMQDSWQVGDHPWLEVSSGDDDPILYSLDELRIS